MKLTKNKIFKIIKTNNQSYKNNKKNKKVNKSKILTSATEELVKSEQVASLDRQPGSQISRMR